jgi:hypothetical protein
MTSATTHLRPQDPGPLDLGEFARTAGLGEGEIRELMEYGLLAAQDLDLRRALLLRDAARLKKDFDLDLFTTGLLAGYLLRISELEDELRRLRAERPQRVVYTEVSFTSVVQSG